MVFFEFFHLGRISMAAYLYHYQVFIFLDKYFGFGKTNKFEATNVIMKFSLVFLVATFVTLCIEEPARNILKKTKTPVAIAGVAAEDIHAP